MAHVTQDEVARLAGVNRSSVSRALRGHPGVSDEERRRIKEVAERLGYRPHPLLTALMQARRGKTPLKHVSLAFVTNYPTREGWRGEHCGRPDFFPGASARARDLGYKLEPFWLAEPGMTAKRFGDILAARGITGLLIGRLPPGLHALELDWTRFSAVALGMTLRSPQLHHVTENHFDTVMQGMQQCIARGYKRVGFCFTDANGSARVGDRWMAAFYYLQQTRLVARDRLPICPGQPASEGEFSAWFRRYRPDALLVNDAPSALAWLRRLGVKVPHDVGLVELEDRDPRISGIYYDPAEIGALAVEMLLGLLHRNQRGIPSHPHELLAAGEWRERGTLPPRGRRARLSQA